MKRFYIKRISDHITIVHRESHQTIWMGSTDEEGKKAIEKFIGMTTKAFYKELNELGLKFKTNNLAMEEVKKDKEEWYNGAWLSTTTQVLELLKIDLEIPEEKFPVDYVRELQTSKSTGWGSSRKEGKKSAKEEVKTLKKEVEEEEHQEEEKPKKLKQLKLNLDEEVKEEPKKLKKLKEVEKPKLPKKLKTKKKEKMASKKVVNPYKTIEEAREAYRGGDISLDLYKKYRNMI